MANENERHADIIAKMRNEGHTGPADALEWVREKMTHYADLLDAAHKREVVALRTRVDMLRFGIEQYRQYHAGVVKKYESKICDTAKLREAVKAVVDVGYPHNFQIEPPHIRGYCYDITRAIEKCFTALAATSSEVPSVPAVPSVPLNAAKLREVAKKAQIFIRSCGVESVSPLPGCGLSASDVISEIDAALAAPVRNCDVGTAMEQGERFSAYCRAHKHPESECLPCPLFGQTGGYCELAWAQMPYEAKEGDTK